MRPDRSQSREQRTKKVHQVVKRLEEFAASQGETINELTKILQVSAGYFTAAKKGEGIIGADVVILVLEHYRDLSPDWLLFGNGSKLRGAVLEKGKITAVSAQKSKLEEDLKKNVEKTKKIKIVFQKLLSNTEKSLDELAKLQSKVK